MSTAIKQRLATVITTLIFAYILLRVLDRLFVVIWVQVPWWGLIIAAIALYLLIDHLVHRLLK